MRKRFWWAKPRKRHPTDRRPKWLQQLDDEISYWLKKTSRLRHDEPFNKREAGRQRREEKRFVAKHKFDTEGDFFLAQEDKLYWMEQMRKENWI